MYLHISQCPSFFVYPNPYIMKIDGLSNMRNWYCVVKILYRGFGSCNTANSSNIGPRNSFRVDSKPVGYLFTDYSGSLFYLTNFFCHFSPKFRCACGRLAESAPVIRQETYRKRQALVTWNNERILAPDSTELKLYKVTLLYTSLEGELSERQVWVGGTTASYWENRL
jgi:hypothetical protein